MSAQGSDHFDARLDQLTRLAEANVQALTELHTLAAGHFRSLDTLCGQIADTNRSVQALSEMMAAQSRDLQAIARDVENLADSYIQQAISIQSGVERRTETLHAVTARRHDALHGEIRAIREDTRQLQSENQQILQLLQKQ
ncbi:MAG: hypothetical protein KME03_20010 [Aphanocapsa lilacina HA4352-LM1]|jgi:hypothetical protein|nr:hypothetical protein [Aphanocapsa lilacina HA4352-LM1]